MSDWFSSPSSSVSDVIQPLMPPRLQFVRPGPLFGSQHSRIDLEFEVLLLDQQLGHGCALSRGNLLYLAFVESALCRSLIHLFALGSQLMHQSEYRRLLCLPHGTNLLSLAIVQLQLMRHVSHGTEVRSPMAEAAMPSTHIRSGNCQASHDYQQRRA